ncbi:MAG TPA: hypothetical protein VN886_06985 [Acidimicrobiales bacterium]|nr:hypothetical protein [Acidimicrobiales bacterium]
MTPLEQACRSLFDQHRVHAFDGVFHVPDVERYPALFAWDSGYHALALRHLDAPLAAGELSTLYRANRLPDGLLSHQRFVPGAETTQRMIEDLFGPMFDGDRTPFVDPPTAAYAAARLSLTIGPTADPLLDAALGHLRALGTVRVVDDGVLPVCLHPFETGTEGSALMRPLLGDTLSSSLTRLRELTVSAIAMEMSPSRAKALSHGFVVYDPTMCGWYLLALEEAALACRARGRVSDAAWAEATADAVADAVEAHLWWEEGHIFVAYDLVGGRQLQGVGAMGLIPAAARTFIDRRVATDVADHHLRPGAPMWGPMGFAAGVVAPGAGVAPFVQWDGNAVWGATAYWAHLLALRLDRRDAAGALREELEARVRAHGFREFYDAWSGEPGGAGEESGFTWPALLLEMAANEDGEPAAG